MDVQIKKLSYRAGLVFLFFTITVHGQNGPVTIIGQHNYSMNNTTSLLQASVECKMIATRTGITSYLLIHYPETVVREEVVDCIYENLFFIDVIEEKIIENELFMKILATTNSQAINSCTN